MVRERDWMDRENHDSGSLAGRFLTRTPSAKWQHSGRGWWQPTRQLSGHRTGSRQPTAQSAAPSPPRVPWKDEQVLLK